LGSVLMNDHHDAFDIPTNLKLPANGVVIARRKQQRRPISIEFGSQFRCQRVVQVRRSLHRRVLLTLLAAFRFPRARAGVTAKR
jgi:hypothetical protein